MLNMLPTNDKKLLDEMYLTIFNKPFPTTIGYVFYDGDTAVGLASVDVNEISALKSVGVLPVYRGKGYGDFFTRSIIFRLIQVSSQVKIGYVDGYFLKFGFVKDGDEMKAVSENVKFDSSCGHC